MIAEFLIRRVSFAEREGSHISEIGALVIRLQAETAQFRQDMGKVKSDLAGLKGETSSASSGMDTFGGSSGGVRVQLGLLDNTIRGRLPMALADLIHQFSNTSAVMTLLPIAATGAAFAALGMIVYKVVEAREAHEKAVADDALAMATATQTQKDKMLELDEEYAGITGGSMAKYRQALADMGEKSPVLASKIDTITKSLENQDTWWTQLTGAASSYMTEVGEALDTQNPDIAQKAGPKTELSKSATDTYLEQIEQQELAAKGLAGAIVSLTEKKKYYDEVSKDNPTANNLQQDTAIARALSDAQDRQKAQKLKDAIDEADANKAMWAEYQKEGEHAMTAIGEKRRKLLGGTDAQPFVVPQAPDIQGGLPEVSGILSTQMSMQDAMAAKAKADIAPFEGIAASSLAALRSVRDMQDKLAEVQGQLDTLEEAKRKLIKDMVGNPANAGEYAAALAQVNEQISQQKKLVQDLNTSWANYFQQMKQSLPTIGTEIRISLQGSMTQFTNSFSQGMAHSIVMGRGFGQTMQQVGAQFLESMLSALIKYEIQSLITDRVRLASTVSTNAAASASSRASDSVNKLSAAKTAAAKAMTTVPFPFDLVVAPLVFAAALSFETGGKIPGGSGAVPIIGHAGETVVTKALTDRVERSEGRGGAGAMHMHYSPQVHALDSEGVDRVLTKHGTTFRRHVEAQIRQMNRR